LADDFHNIVTRLIADPSASGGWSRFRKASPRISGVAKRVAMKTILILVLPLAVVGAGCTAMSLERHTVSQIQSVTDFRYQATLHALAMVAADPGTLPSYALISSGTTSVADTGLANPVTTWKASPLLFASEALSFSATHSPMIQWTVDPTADETQLKAMRCACRWVLEGREHLDSDCEHILADPEADPTPGPHFGVADRLARLPQGWLHFGCWRDVPLGACYKDHCGGTWVWVTPDGTEGLAGFTLVLQDIATLLVSTPDNTMPANVSPPLLVTLWVVQNTIKPANSSVVVININQPPPPPAPPAPGAPAPAPNGPPTVDPPCVTLRAGQSIVWNNPTPYVQTVNSTVQICNNAGAPCPCLFSAIIQPGTCSAPVVFDQNMFINAGGQPDQTVSIAYTITGSQAPPSCPCPATTPTSYTSKPLTIKLAVANPLYSPTLVFRVDRVVKPECREMIECRMNGELCKDQPQTVGISWDDWMNWTTPYQGQRAAVKPGAATAIAVPQPPTRLAMPFRLLSAPVPGPGGNKPFLPVPRPPAPPAPEL
jgi:hypothetical protein